MKVLSLDKQLNYLNRLGLNSEAISLPFLKKIIQAHALKIHYENLDLYYGIKILLDVDFQYQKIIKNKRGGYALELNCLLYHFLYALGFDVKLHECRFYSGNQEWTEPFSHLVLKVVIDNQVHLVDIGQPLGIAGPLKILFNNVQLNFTHYYRFSPDHNRNLILEKSTDSSNFQPFLLINENPSLPIEFIPIHDKYQYDTHSRYRQNKRLFKKTQSGYIDLNENQISFLSNGKKRNLPVTDSAHFQVFAFEYFGVDMRNLFE